MSHGIARGSRRGRCGPLSLPHPSGGAGKPRAPARAFVVSIGGEEYHIADFSEGRDSTYVFDPTFKLVMTTVGLD
jgi:hypothetical protein